MGSFSPQPEVPGTWSLRAGVEAEGTEPIFLISLLLVAPVTSYDSLLAPRTEKNWHPSPPSEVVLTGPNMPDGEFLSLHVIQIEAVRSTQPEIPHVCYVQK